MLIVYLFYVSLLFPLIKEFGDLSSDWLSIIKFSIQKRPRQALCSFKKAFVFILELENVDNADFKGPQVSNTCYTTLLKYEGNKYFLQIYK